MLYGVGAEVFDSLLAGPLAVFVLLLKGEELVDNLEQPLVLLIDPLDSKDPCGELESFQNRLIVS